MNETRADGEKNAYADKQPQKPCPQRVADGIGGAVHAVGQRFLRKAGEIFVVHDASQYRIWLNCRTAKTEGSLKPVFRFQAAFQKRGIVNGIRAA